MTQPPERPALGLSGPSGVQVGDGNRQANVDGVFVEHLTINHPPAVPLDATAAVHWPVVVGGRAPLQADGYVDRPALREAVAYAPGAGTVLSPAGAQGATRVVVGDGGIGKTQLAAAAYASARTAGVDLAGWITARDRAALVTAYAQAWTAVTGRPASGDADADAVRFLTWLDTTDRTWFLVLDDLVDPADLTGLWPQGPAGQVVVTTRRRDASLRGHGRLLVELNAFTPAEALDYLTGKLITAPGMPDAVLNQAADLAADLGCLPVALAQAAATILDQAISCAEYRSRLTDRSRALAEVFASDSGDEYERTLASAWSLAIEQADTLSPVGLTRPLIHLVAVLDPNGIPDTVLTNAAACAHVTSTLQTTGARQDPGGSTPVVSPELVREALRAGHRLSLITHDPAAGPRAVRMHAMAQRAALDPITPDHYDALILAAADALIEAWPQVENDPALAGVLRGNAGALAGNDTRHVLWATPSGTVHDIVFQPLSSLDSAGAHGQAITAAHALLDQATARLGPDHPATLTARSWIAQQRGYAGDLAGAITALAELLPDRVRVLGPDHPETLKTRSNLASFRGLAGDPSGAAIAFAELLPDRVRVLGPDHPDTLANRGLLARFRGEAGDAAGAAAAYAELLPDVVRVQGRDHPATMTGRQSLARFRGEAGDAAGAVAALTDLLADRLRIMGPDHPHTLNTRAHLARFRGEADDAAGAAAAFADLLTDRIRVLGADHPDTVTTRASLTFWRHRAGITGLHPELRGDAGLPPPDAVESSA